MGRSIGHDAWEREVTQDIDERGRVRVTAPGIVVSFRRPPSAAEIVQILAAHAPTPVFEAREAEVAAALAARSAEIEDAVKARVRLGAREDQERALARQQVADELQTARRARRAADEQRGALRALSPLTLDELREIEGKR